MRNLYMFLLGMTILIFVYLGSVSIRKRRHRYEKNKGIHYTHYPLGS